MSSISNYLEAAILNHIYRGNIGGTVFAQPSSLFVALYTSDPTDADSGAEITDAAYVRQPVTFGAPVVGVAKTTIANDVLITFPAATVDWGVVTHFGIKDALTAGNLLDHGQLTVPKSIMTLDVAIFSVGDIEISRD